MSTGNSAPRLRLLLLPALVCLLLPPGGGTVNVLSGAEFGILVKHVAQEALGARLIQEHYDKEANYSLRMPDGEKTLAKITNDLSLYIGKISDMVHRNYNAILLSLTTPMNESREHLIPLGECCDINDDTLREVPHLGIRVDPNNLCVRFQSDLPSNSKEISDYLFVSMHNNAMQIRNVGWQYYGNENGDHTTYMARKVCKGEEKTCCYRYDPRTRPWYNTARAPTPNDIVIVIDITKKGNLLLKLRAAKMIITAASADARLAVVAFCRIVRVPGGQREPACFHSSLALATGQNVKILLDFLLTLPSSCKGSADYQPAIVKAFKYFRDAPDRGPNVKKLLVIVADSNVTRPEIFANIISKAREENNYPQINNKVLIQTYGIGNITATTENLLRTLAQDTKYIDVNGKEIRGIYTHIVNDVSNLRYEMRHFFSVFSENKAVTMPIITAPYVDFSGLGLVVSFCLPVVLNSTLQGVTCVDSRVEDIFLNVTYFKQDRDNYLFIIDSEGRAISHPLLPAPSAVNHDPVTIDIQNLEREQETQAVIASMKSGNNGSKTFYVKRWFSRGGFYESSSREVLSHYHWRKIANTDFSICMVYTDENSEVVMTVKNRDADVNYHHPSLIEGPVCTIAGNYTATTEYGTVRFNGSAYEFLNLFQSEHDQALQDQNYFDQINGGDLGNHLKGTILSDVLMAGYADRIWKESSSSSAYSFLLLWRYLVTTTGVTRVFPGTYFRSFNPRLQPWYQDAISHRGLNVMTRIRTRRDKYAVMMSTAIFKGSQNRRHSSYEPAVAVVAGEFVPDFLYGMLTMTFEACRSGDAVCFMVDDKGYILAHTDYHNRDGPHCHLVEVEHDIAKHLQKIGDMEYHECIDWEKHRTIRSWILSPKGGVVQSSSPHYELHKVVGTNVLVGITWRSPNKLEPRCKCATMKNCTADSECPCYNQIKFNHCANKVMAKIKESTDLPSCPISPEYFDPFVPFQEKENLKKSTGPCFENPCPKATRKSECAPPPACAWCTIGDRSFCQDRPCPAPPVNTNRPYYTIVIILSVILVAVALVLVVLAICFWLAHRKIAKELSRLREDTTNKSITRQRSSSFYRYIRTTLAPHSRTGHSSHGSDRRSVNEEHMDISDYSDTSTTPAPRSRTGHSSPGSDRRSVNEEHMNMLATDPKMPPPVPTNRSQNADNHNTPASSNQRINMQQEANRSNDDIYANWKAKECVLFKEVGGSISCPEINPGVTEEGSDRTYPKEVIGEGGGSSDSGFSTDGIRKEDEIHVV